MKKTNRREWLIDLRNQQNLTQEEVAKNAGIDRSYYTKIENGLTPSVKVAKAIGKFLEIEWTLFFEDDCDEKEQLKPTTA